MASCPVAVPGSHIVAIEQVIRCESVLEQLPQSAVFESEELRVLDIIKCSSQPGRVPDYDLQHDDSPLKDQTPSVLVEGPLVFVIGDDVERISNESQQGALRTPHSGSKIQWGWRSVGEWPDFACLLGQAKCLAVQKGCIGGFLRTEEVCEQIPDRTIFKDVRITAQLMSQAGIVPGVEENNGDTPQSTPEA